MDMWFIATVILLIAFFWVLDWAIKMRKQLKSNKKDEGEDNE